MIVIVCMQKKQSKQEILEKTKVFSLGIIILLLLFLRAGIGLFMEYQRNYKKAIRYMPELTTARIQQFYNYTSGNGLVLTDAMTADKVYERVRLVTLKKGRMKVKVIRKREFKDFNDRLLLPCVIETY